MPRILKALILLVLATSATTAILLVRARSDRVDGLAADPLTPDPRVGTMVFPPFSLMTQENKTITKSDFDGRLTVVDFFFTNCPFVCPTLTGKMIDLGMALKDLPPEKVRFLSISVDPAHDTPAVLAEYAKNHDANPARWTFATAAQGGISEADAVEKIRAIAADGLKFEVGADPARPIELAGGSKMSNVKHPSFLVLIGPKGDVLDIFAATVPGEVERAAERIRAGAARLGK